MRVVNLLLKKTFLHLLAVLSLLSIILFSGLYVGVSLVPPLHAEFPEYSVQVLDQKGILLRLYRSSDGLWCLPVDSKQVDDAFIQELLAYEDKRFFEHSGVDWLALLRAVGQWIANGRVISGASTITMQTVRLLYPRPRTLHSKFIEMVQAFRLEKKLGKRGILDLYLTLAPYGGNLQGLRVATRFYFGKEPYRLTPSERALLIALPQSPAFRRPDKHPQNALAGRDHVLARLFDAGMLANEDVVLARTRPIPTSRLRAPIKAAHLSDRLRYRQPARLLFRTTIDGDFQWALEQLAQSRQAEFEDGVTLAVLAIDFKTSQVIGYVGSGGFFTAGQLDLVTAVRSPGSALKPFIYGLGFERQIIHPETRLLDQPGWIGEYGPRNFDARYRGVVNIREALQKSLNTPAVRVLHSVGALRFHRRLVDVGVSLRLPAHAEPGLPMALGGVGITLEELTRLYAGLANAGRMVRLRYLQGESRQPIGRLLSPVASWYLDDILAGTEPPAGYLSNRPIRFKTGTSYGFRDAWAIGYAGKYAVGVWVGRPDGGYNADMTGRDAAAPLLFKIFDLLTLDQQQQFMPKGVLQATYLQLPPLLKWFGSDGSEKGRHSSPKIRFPVDGSLTVLDQQSEMPGISLMVEGGRAPYHWLVDGIPVASNVLQRHAQWHPNGQGYSRITVIDALGLTDHIGVWLQ